MKRNSSFTLVVLNLFILSVFSIFLLSCKAKKKTADPSTDMIYEAIADTAFIRNADTLSVRIAALDDVLKGTTDHPTESLKYRPELADTLNEALLLGMMPVNGTICDGLTKENTYIIEVDKMSRQDKARMAEGKESSEFSNIRQKLKDSSYHFASSARNIPEIVNQLVKLKYLVTEDVWMHEEPRMTSSDTYQSGLVLKKLHIYDLNSRKRVQSFFLARQSGDSVFVVKKKKEPILVTPGAVRGDVFLQYFRKRDSLLFPPREK